MQAKMKNKSNFLFKVVKNGKMIQRYQTRSKRKFYNRARTINWENSPLKAYLRVSYGMKISNLGKMESFWNDGHYEAKEDFWGALKDFTE